MKLKHIKIMLINKKINKYLHQKIKSTNKSILMLTKQLKHQYLNKYKQQIYKNKSLKYKLYNWQIKKQ